MLRQITKTEPNFVLLVILLIVFGHFLIPGPRASGDFPYAFSDFVKQGFNIPQTWSDRTSVDLGEFVLHTLWAWPIDFLYGLGRVSGLDFSILERLIGILPVLVLGVWGMGKLLDRVGLRGWPKDVGVLVYLLNTYILLVIDGGQFSIALTYVWFPVAFYEILQGVDRGLKEKILAGISVSVLGFLDIRFVYVLLLLLLFTLLYRGKGLVSWLKTGAVVLIIFFGLNFYWILPSVSGKAPSLPTVYSRTDQTSFLNFTQLKHSVSLLQPHWYENVFGKIPPFKKEFLLIPVLAFLALVLKRKNKEVWFWTVVALVSVLLTKGANLPLPDIYPWLFTHVPGFSLFRDSTKFFFLVALSYSVLIGYTVDEITKRFSKLKVIFPLFVIAYFLFLVRPVYLGKMTGTFSEPRYRNEYFSLASKLEKDESFGRIFWIPSKAPLGFSSPTHPTVEAGRLESLRPFAVATVGSFETQNFIREGSYMGELFDIAGIKYIAYPYFDPKRDDMSQEKVGYYNTFLNQIGALPWISEKISDIPVPVFKTKESKEKLFLSGSTYFVVGSDRIYSDIEDLGAKFANNALVFVEENKETVNQIEKVPGAKILLYDKNITDLILSFADSNKFISPSKTLDFSPNETGWWKRESIDLVWLRDFLQQKYGIDNLDFDYGSGWAIAEGEKQLEVKSPLVTKGNILFARVMQSSKGREVGFYQNAKPVGSVDTKVERPEKVTIKLTGNDKIPDKFFEYDKADFYWIRVGEILEDGRVTIRTKGDINIVNSLVIISPEQEKELSQRTETLEKEGRIVEWEKLGIGGRKSLLTGENKALISYETLAPTHYKVKIEGLENPTTLFFSETFDDGWELNSVKGYKLYSFINGFWVEKDGEYDLYFAPQKYVVPGLVVSIITLTSCIIILAWRKGNKSAQPLKKSS